MRYNNIIQKLPYRNPFLFVDELTEVTHEKVIGHYTFPEEAFFYQGHFIDNPVTPGVILTETMAQIGVVCMGLFIIEKEGLTVEGIAMSSNQIDFYLPVLPGEKVTVESEKVYFRFNKLKCSVQLKNETGKLVCKGFISGMIKTKI